MQQADTICIDNQLNFSEFYQVHTGEQLPPSYTSIKLGFDVRATGTKGRYTTDATYSYETTNVVQNST